MSPKGPFSGISLNTDTGKCFVPSSTRADGTVRKELRVRPGYKPAEDIERYKPPGARSTTPKSKLEKDHPLVTASQIQNTKPETNTATLINEKLKDLEILRLPAETGKVDMASKNKNTGANKGKARSTSVSNENIEKRDIIRQSNKSPQTREQSPMVTYKQALQQDLPLRSKKSTQTIQTAWSSEMISSKSSSPSSDREGSETERGSTAQSATSQNAEQTGQKNIVHQGTGNKMEPDAKRILGKEAKPEEIPTLSEMRKMVQNMPTMASLGFWLPRSHKSRKANTCHASYYTLRRSQRKKSWAVAPTSEAEQWFDASSTLED